MMIRVLALASILALASGPALLAGEECCPVDGAASDQQVAVTPVGGPGADQPLPEGHPDISSGQGRQLPEGHPDISGGRSGSGMGGGMGQPGMPSGHPPIGGGAQAPFQATIVIKAQQHTEAGADLAGTPVKVALYEGGRTNRELSVTLDANGMAMLDGIDARGVIQPIVSLEFDGVPYQEIGRPMAAAKPDQVVRLELYEATTETPEWKIGNRHVMTQMTPQGLQVLDIIQVEVAGDRAWVGKPIEADADTGPNADPHAERQITLSLPVPENATDIRLGDGFSECCSVIETGRVATRDPVMPGATEYRVGYIIPVEQGAAALPIRNPAPVDHMLVFAPDDGTKVDAPGLGEPRVMQSQTIPVRAWQVAGLEASKTVTLQFQAAQDGPAEAGAAEPSAAAPEAEKIQATPGKVIAGVGGGALVLLTGVVLFLKNPRSAGRRESV